MSDRFFVTGALGCLGAWVVRILVSEGVPVTVFDVGADPHRLRLIMSPEALAKVNFIVGDITDLPALEQAMQGSTHVIHLAALQVPFCRADPPLGARVNVVGTINMFETAKKLGLKQMVYASSAAVFGQSEDYPEEVLGDDALPRPNNLYGVYKLANEGSARIYWQENQFASAGLRPYTVYGPGRDQGMTSGPTKAMLAAAAGLPYHIPFGGRGAFQYTDDVARIFIQVARANLTGAAIYNLRGSIAHMREVVAAIEAAAPEVAGKVTFAEQSLPLPEATDDAGLRALLGQVPATPLNEGVAATVSLFREAVAAGKIKPVSA